MRRRWNIIILFAGGWNAGTVWGIPVPHFAVMLAIMGVVCLLIVVALPDDFFSAGPR